MRTRPAPRIPTVAPVSLPNSPLLPAAIAGGAGTVFVLLRLLDVARGDASRFVVAGTTFTDPVTAPRGLHTPGAAFGAWQLTIRAVTGALPARSDANSNLSLPFVAMVRGIHHFLTLMPSETATVWVGELIVLAVVAGLAAWSMGSSSGPAHERLSWVLMLALLVSLSSAVWSNSADFRAFDELFLLSWLVLLGSRRRHYGPALMTAGAWIVVAIYHVNVL